MLTVIDLGLGNIGSVVNMFRRLGEDVDLLRSPDDGEVGSPLVLPGVGAFDEGVRRMHATGWFEVLRDAPPSQPILGICLGMQLLGNGSEEGSLDGLGRIDMRMERFRSELRLPHMGWNFVQPSADPLFKGADPEPRFYFAHTYRATGPEDAVVARSEYGETFAAVVRSAQTVGVQFHPEKSHRFGMHLLQQWAAAC